MSCEEGVFARVNKKLIDSGVYNNCIVSIVCKMKNYDANGIVVVECSDGGIVSISVDDAFLFKQDQIVEIMGLLVNANVPVEVSVLLLFLISFTSTSLQLIYFCSLFYLALLSTM